MKIRTCVMIALAFAMVSCSGEMIHDPRADDPRPFVADSDMTSPTGITLTYELGGTLSPGEAVSLVLRNGTDALVGYNLCISGLIMRSETEWVAIPSDRVCTLELRHLPPGEDARYGTEIPSGLESGTYRFVAGVQVDVMRPDPQVLVFSEPFTVEGDPGANEE